MFQINDDKIMYYVGRVIEIVTGRARSIFNIGIKSLKGGKELM